LPEAIPTMSQTLSVKTPLTAADGEPLTVKLARERRNKQLKAVALVAPLAIFLLLTFLVPIFMLLGRSVDNPEVVTNLPATSKLIASWDRRALPSEDVFQAMARDLTAAKEAKTVPEVAKRLNMDISGFRSLIQKTARKMPLELAARPVRRNWRRKRSALLSASSAVRCGSAFG